MRLPHRRLNFRAAVSLRYRAAAAVQVRGQSALKLLQASRGDDYSTATERLIRFSRDGDGRATALTLSQGGGVLQGKRLD